MMKLYMDEDEQVASTLSKAARRVKIETGHTWNTRLLPVEMGVDRIPYVRLAQHWRNNKPTTCPRYTPKGWGGNEQAVCPVCELSDLLNESGDDNIRNIGYQARCVLRYRFWCLVFDKEDARGKIEEMTDDEILKPYEFDMYRTTWDDWKKYQRWFTSRRKGAGEPSEWGVMDLETGCNLLATHGAKGVRLDRMDPSPIFELNDPAWDSKVARIWSLVRKPVIVIPTEEQLLMLAQKFEEDADGGGGRRSRSASGGGRSRQRSDDDDRGRRRAVGEDDDDDRPARRSSRSSAEDDEPRSRRSVREDDTREEPAPSRRSARAEDSGVEERPESPRVDSRSMSPPPRRQAAAPPEEETEAPRRQAQQQSDDSGPPPRRRATEDSNPPEKRAATRQELDEDQVPGAEVPPQRETSQSEQSPTPPRRSVEPPPPRRAPAAQESSLPRRQEAAQDDAPPPPPRRQAPAAQQTDAQAPSPRHQQAADGSVDDDDNVPEEKRDPAPTVKGEPLDPPPTPVAATAPTPGRSAAELRSRLDQLTKRGR